MPLRLAPSLLILAVLHHAAVACLDPRQLPSALSAANTCLPRLRTHRASYDVCRSQTCFLFIREAPFTILPPAFTASAPHLQAPFPCGRPRALHSAMRGAAFAVHNRTASAASPCIWAGAHPRCTFNALVDFIDVMADHGYRFAVTGLLLQMPDRECRLRPGAPLVDDAVTIVGRRGEGRAETAAAAFRQLTAPFDAGTWAVFAAVLAVLVACAVLIARDEPGFSKRPLGAVLSVLFGPQDGHAQSAKYARTRLLFRLAFAGYFLVFLMLYEAAVTNFLFRQHNHVISKNVRALSSDELRDYSVIRNSALERVWNIIGTE